MFRSNKLYIQIGRNTVTVVNLETGVEATRTSIEPFSTKRSVLSSFGPANDTLMAAMRELGLKKRLLKTKAIIQQMEDTDDGITDIEKRALRDLAENAGAEEVHIMEGERRLSNEEALSKIDG